MARHEPANAQPDATEYEPTLNDLHLWMFNAGYAHVWFEFIEDMEEVHC